MPVANASSAPTATPFARMVHVARVLASHGAGAAWGRLSGSTTSGAERFRSLVESLGGSFIKFGQVLASQPDLLPQGYAEQLLDLLDRVAPVPVAEIHEELAQELGPAAALLTELADTPLASASIAQVHLARVDGQMVAVKVQRPGVEATFRADVRLMMWLLGTVRLFRIRALYWLDEPIREFAAWTDEELDFRREARHLQLIGRNSEGRPHVRLPRVFEEVTSRRVLVTEYLAGVPIADVLRARATGDTGPLARLIAEGFDASVFARQVIRNFTVDAFRHGLFHADLHPGNLLILPNNTVGYVDFGITGTVAPYARTWLAAMTLALVRRDIADLHRCFLKLVVPRDDADAAGFRAGLEALADGWYGGPGGTRLMKPAALVMMEMLQVSREHAMLPEREAVKYIRSVMTLDGVVSAFAPDLELGTAIEEAAMATLDAQTGNQLPFSAWALGLRAVETGRTLAGRGLASLTAVTRLRAAGVSALQAATLVLASAFCVLLAPLPLHAGVNLATAELLTGTAALVVLLVGLVRHS